jgi:transcriptional regulator with XRE-family HTH domain
MHKPNVAVAAGRRYTGQTQAGLARALEAETGQHWSRVMVARLERGDKVLDVETLMAVAKIQQLPVGFYLYGPSATVPNSPIPGYINSDLVIPEDFPAAA